MQRNWIFACYIGVLIALLSPSASDACHRPGDLGLTVNNTIRVRVELSRTIHYEFSATCFTTKASSSSGLPYVASGIWDPAENRATERLSGEGSWHHQWADGETTWSCPTDPWLTKYVFCKLLSNTLQPLYSSMPPPEERPFSAWSADVLAMREHVKNATPAAPALPPRDVAALSYALNRVKITWGIPADQTSLHRTIAWYQVWRRPPSSQATTWFIASGKLAATAISHNDPDPAPVNTQYTVCAINIGGQTCAPAVAALRSDTTTVEAQTGREAALPAGKSGAAAVITNQTVSNQPKAASYPTLHPNVRAPTAGQRFSAQSAVPIVLAPPQGWNVTSYTVNIQRREANGNWVLQTTLPVGAADAHSATGYTGFGAGGGTGPSKYPALLTSQGSWRLNAQVSAPNQTGWSDWVEFTVWQSPVSTTVTKQAPPSLAR
jgi:hypothetical protein